MPGQHQTCVPGGDLCRDGREHLLCVHWCLLQERRVMAGISPEAWWVEGMGHSKEQSC